MQLKTKEEFNEVCIISAIE